jgi:SagB-type dehydrogenase family enzyme
VGLLLAWRTGVSVTVDNGSLVVAGPGVRTTLRDVGASARDAFHRLAPPGTDEDQLAEAVADQGPGALPRWFYYLDHLTRRGLVGRSAHEGGGLLATLVAVAPAFVWKPVSPVAGCRYVLSRFAYLHREGHEAILESPLSHARVVLHDHRAAGLIGALAVPATTADLTSRTGLSEEGVCGVLTLLLRAGMLGEDGCEPEELRTWAFHDLLFHARSRKGRSGAPYGGTYRFVDELPAPPALKPIPAGTHVPLYRPELEALERGDPPLAWVQEHRRSIREFNTACPITVEQLGEFLFRVNRVKEHREGELETVRGPVVMDFAARPYPAGGGLYELEVYAVVGVCTGLDAGLYYHDPAAHRLVHVRGSDSVVSELLGDAAESAGVPGGVLQVLLVLAARVPRVAWKYESIAYSLVLKHVGVVYQTMYLAATAMGLAACALGGGDADLFARAAGLPYAAETSVGEFLLGAPAERAAGE